MTTWRTNGPTARHLLHQKSPWLYFNRDHPLRHGRWRALYWDNDYDHEDYWDQEERLAWILALPDDEDMVD